MNFDPSKSIAGERHVMQSLNAEGWIGKPLELRALAYWGEDLRQRYENECSHAWAGNSDRYKDGTRRVEEHITRLAREAGLALYIQGDCRGVAVYVRSKGRELTDRNYSSRGYALHYERHES